MEAINSINGQIDDLRKKAASNAATARRLNLFWKVSQAIIFIIGIATPMIVTYRKSSFFPQQFWVMWCMITPLLTTIISFAMSYFDWQGNSTQLSKHATLLENLAERAQTKSTYLQPSDYQNFQDWIFDEKQKINALL